MKRTFLILLALIMILGSFASYAVAEDFSLRGGVKYGMTESEVKETEKSNGNSISPSEVSPQTDKNVKGIRYKDISIAGLDNCTLDYYFSKDGKLIEIDYFLGPNGYAPPSGTYESMKETLTSKYGEPVINATGDMLDLTSYSLADNLLLYSLLGGKFNGLCQWMVEYDDCVAVIEIYNFGMSNPIPYVDYRLYTKEEVQAVIQENTDQMKNQEDARNNDL